MVTATFGTPPALVLTSFQVEQGSAERSYIRYVDLTFNESAGLQALVDSIHNGAGDRVELIHYDLNGQNGQRVSLSGEVSAVDQVMEFDFGPNGLGGSRTSTAADGYYELKLDLDGDGTFETVEHFYRLFADVNGDGVVDNQDLVAITAAFGQTGAGLDMDINGDGVVNATDRLLASTARGHRLAAGLPIDN